MAWTVPAQRSPGELITAGIWNSTIPDNLQSLPERVAVTATGTQNNLDLGASGPWIVVRAANASALTITGLVFQDDNDVVVIEAVDAAVTLSHEAAGSTAANRLDISTGADVTLAAGERAMMIYDATDSRWRLGPERPGGGSVLFTAGGNPAAGDTEYSSTGHASASSSVGGAHVPSPVAGTIRRLYAHVSSAPQTGESVTVTLMVNSSPTALTLTISNTDTTGNDLTNTVAVAAGDEIALRFVASNNGSYTVPIINASAEIVTQGA